LECNTLIGVRCCDYLFFFSSRRRHTRCLSDWSSDVCSSDLPSIPLVVYSLISDTSVGYLFLGGVVPGLLLGAAQMSLIAYVARRQNFPVERPVPMRELPRITGEAFPALMMPVILLGALYSGITTPTEAAAL